MALTKDRNLSKENGIMKGEVIVTTFLCLEQAIVDTLHESKQYWNNRIVYTSKPCLLHWGAWKIKKWDLKPTLSNNENNTVLE